MIEVKGVTIDKKWKWIAKDADGKVCVYTRVPTTADTEDGWKTSAGSCTFIKIYPLVMENVPWDQSLHEIRHIEYGIMLIPWRPNLVVDDPVMVRNDEKSSWRRRHFAGWTDKGRIQAWDRGCTSFSSAENAKTWTYYRLPTPEELNHNANHK